MKEIMVLTLALGLSLSVRAGDKGNGGVSVVCRDSQGVIKSAELLDIYEGHELYQRQYAQDNLDIETKIKLMQLNLVQFPALLKKFQDELSKVYSNLVFVDRRNLLESTDDALPIISRKGCKYEQVANYTNDGELFVSQEIYDAFDVLNKASLYVHEALYAIYRRGKNPVGLNSRDSRKLTAYLMGKGVEETVLKTLVLRHLATAMVPVGTDSGTVTPLNYLPVGSKILINKDISVGTGFNSALFDDGRQSPDSISSERDGFCRINLRDETNHYTDRVLRAGRELTVTKVEVTDGVSLGRKEIVIHVDSKSIEKFSCSSDVVASYNGRRRWDVESERALEREVGNMQLSISDAKREYGDYLTFVIPAAREIED